MTENAQSGPTVRRNDDERRYEILVDGEVAGFTEFIDHGDVQRIFPHTVVDEKFAGRGLATRLIHDALVDTRAQQRRVVPVCPAVVRYVAKHPEVADIVDPVTDEIREILS